jgi:hypothetical protein
MPGKLRGRGHGRCHVQQDRARLHGRHRAGQRHCGHLAGDQGHYPRAESKARQGIRQGKITTGRSLSLPGLLRGLECCGTAITSVPFPPQSSRSGQRLMVVSRRLSPSPQRAGRTASFEDSDQQPNPATNHESGQQLSALLTFRSWLIVRRSQRSASGCCSSRLVPEIAAASCPGFPPPGRDSTFSPAILFHDERND